MKAQVRLIPTYKKHKLNKKIDTIYHRYHHPIHFTIIDSLNQNQPLFLHALYVFFCYIIYLLPQTPSDKFDWMPDGDWFCQREMMRWIGHLVMYSSVSKCYLSIIQNTERIQSNHISFAIRYNLQDMSNSTRSNQRILNLKDCTKKERELRRAFGWNRILIRTSSHQSSGLVEFSSQSTARRIQVQIHTIYHAYKQKILIKKQTIFNIYKFCNHFLN
jgi:hypothetical protein